MSFFNNDAPYEAEPTLEYILKETEDEMKSSWLLIQNEVECDYENADISKIKSLLANLRKLDEKRTNLLECIDRRDGVLYGEV